MRAFAVPASVLVPLLLLGSCRPPAPVLGPLPSGAAVQRYDEALATWTRRSRAYRRMESRIIVSATCLSARFRAARDAEYVRLFGASPQELDAWRRGLEEAAAEHDVFFLAVSTPSRDWNDLDLAGSIWKLSLENDRGLRAVPVRIVADRSGSPTLRHFFPDLGHFSMGYWVHFPRDPTVLDPAAAWFRLSLRGPLATVELVWEIGKEGRQEGGQLSELPHSE